MFGFWLCFVFRHIRRIRPDSLMYLTKALLISCWVFVAQWLDSEVWHGLWFHFPRSRDRLDLVHFGIEPSLLPVYCVLIAT
ncbi:Uncharacterized protein APZ42_004773 [Daphnia magna]|uniref:Uncharacterized protein n=1 Tax=Daphnia magna TaxID=35525 RepID=A0A164GUT4_9CRUS|nr:Uncharacterized protein APZ42_004773 [Daphnia magna]